MSNSRATLLHGLKRLGTIAGKIDALDQEARAAWSDVKPLLVGIEARRYGWLHRITGGYVHQGIVMVSGVRSSKQTGQFGKRQYAMGRLSDCELIDQPLDAPEDV